MDFFLNRTLFFYIYLPSFKTYLHTYDELTKLYKCFSKYLTEIKNSVLVNGYPNIRFKALFDFSYDLSYTYPVKIPFEIKVKKTSKNTHQNIYKWKKNDTISALPNNYIQCSYHEAPFIKNFSLNEIRKIESKREKIFNVKEEVIKILYESLVNRKDFDFWDFWHNCLNVFIDNLSVEEMIFFTEIQKKYRSVNLEPENNTKELISNIGLVNGGVFTILATAVKVLLELKFGTIHNTKSNLLPIINKFKNISILEFLNPEIVEIDTIIKKLFILTKEEDRFYRNSEQHFMQDFQTSFKAPLLVKGEYYKFIESINLTLENGNKLSIGFNFPDKTFFPSQKRITPLELPPGTKWEHIVMQFIDNDKIRITAPNNIKYVTNYREMGFEDKRRLFPDTQWKFLHLLAIHGNLSWENLAEMTHVKNIKEINKLVDQAKKKKQKIKERFIRFFQINEDPFYLYSKSDGYHPKFKILPQEHLQ